MFCIFSILSILRRTKKFLPIGKITAHFAYRFFSIQEKFAHYSKNLGCATASTNQDPMSNTDDKYTNAQQFLQNTTITQPMDMPDVSFDSNHSTLQEFEANSSITQGMYKIDLFIFGT